MLVTWFLSYVLVLDMLRTFFFLIWFLEMNAMISSGGERCENSSLQSTSPARATPNSPNKTNCLNTSKSF